VWGIASEPQSEARERYPYQPGLQNLRLQLLRPRSPFQPPLTPTVKYNKWSSAGKVSPLPWSAHASLYVEGYNAELISGLFVSKTESIPDKYDSFTS
jgi:hypothetical protein